MNILPAGPGAYAVHIALGDPAYPRAAAEEQALVKNILHRLRPHGCPQAQVSLFPGKEELLMLIRIPETLFAAHAATLEEVLRLSGAARRHPDAALYFADRRYVMVYRASGGAPAVRFFPFPDEYLLHLEEHGKCLIPADAGNFLIRTFFRRSPSFY